MELALNGNGFKGSILLLRLNISFHAGIFVKKKTSSLCDQSTASNASHNESYRTTHSARVNFASEQIRPSKPLTDDEELQSTIYFLFSLFTYMTANGTKQGSGSHNKLHAAYEEANIKTISIGPS
jgi:hypothetical protein